MKFQHLVVALLVLTIIGNFYFLRLMVDNQRKPGEAAICATVTVLTFILRGRDPTAA